MLRVSQRSRGLCRWPLLYNVPSVLYVCRNPSRTIIFGPLATNHSIVSCQGCSVCKQWTRIDEYDHWPTSAKFDRELHLSGTTSVERSHVPMPSSSSFHPSLAPRLLDPQSVFQGRGSLPVARVPNLPKYGALRSRGPPLDGAVRRICLKGFRKQQARLLSLWLTGHIRDLACSLVITIRVGNITATSCQPVKTVRRVPWPKGLCERKAVYQISR